MNGLIPKEIKFFNSINPFPSIFCFSNSSIIRPYFVVDRTYWVIPMTMLSFSAKWQRSKR